MDERIPSIEGDFESLLSWLSVNREHAGEVYEKIRIGLIRYFYFKGCRNAEDLADQTISRVVAKLPQLDLTLGNKPISICYGFASKVALEELRRDKIEIPLELDIRENLRENKEEAFECLDSCLAKLPANEQHLIREYYAKDKSEKFDHRRKLAESAGIAEGTLHVKLHRLRKILRPCIERCLEKK